MRPYKNFHTGNRVNKTGRKGKKGKSIMDGLRAEAAQHCRENRGAPGSAFEMLGQRNADNAFGMRRGSGGGMNSRGGRIGFGVNKRRDVGRGEMDGKGAEGKANEKSAEEEAVVEVWRPAGGEQALCNGDSQASAVQSAPSTVLVIARISTWRLQTFLAEVKSLIVQGDEAGDVLTKEIRQGAESLTDVCVEFLDEDTADMMRIWMDGAEILGRTLQVRFWHR